MNRKIFAVDCDGTLFENKYPEIGAPNTKLIEYLKKQQAGGDVDLILWTCRVGKRLTEAIYACYQQGLVFDYINENTKEVIKEFGSDCRKIFAHEYIDDRAVHNPEFELPFRPSECDADFNLSFYEFRGKYPLEILTSLDISGNYVNYLFIWEDGFKWCGARPNIMIKTKDCYDELEHKLCRQAQKAYLENMKKK